MKALTLHAPWAHAVAWLGKDIENRSWRPPASVIGTRIAIHAGARATEDEWSSVILTSGKPVPLGGFATSAIVATAIIGEPVTESDSPWFIPGNFGWPLIDVRRLPEPIPCKGRLGLWALPEGLVLP